MEPVDQALKDGLRAWNHDEESGWGQRERERERERVKRKQSGGVKTLVKQKSKRTRGFNRLKCRKETVYLGR